VRNVGYRFVLPRTEVPADDRVPVPAT